MHLNNPHYFPASQKHSHTQNKWLAHTHTATHRVLSKSQYKLFIRRENNNNVTLGYTVEFPKLSRFASLQTHENSPRKVHMEEEEEVRVNILFKIYSIRSHRDELMVICLTVGDVWCTSTVQNTVLLHMTDEAAHREWWRSEMYVSNTSTKLGNGNLFISNRLPAR